LIALGYPAEELPAPARKRATRIARFHR